MKYNHTEEYNHSKKLLNHNNKSLTTYITNSSLLLINEFISLTSLSFIARKWVSIFVLIELIWFVFQFIKLFIFCHLISDCISKLVNCWSKFCTCCFLRFSKFLPWTPALPCDSLSLEVSQSQCQDPLTLPHQMLSL